MTLREQLNRAQPKVDGPTYNVLKGNITEKQYREAVRKPDGRAISTPATGQQRADRSR